MKVAFVPRYGPPDVVEFREAAPGGKEFREAATPTPAADQLRMKVMSAAVTAGDWRVRSGLVPRGFGALRGLALGFGGPRNPVLGTDAAGIVDAVGSAVTRFAVGDAVVAFPGSAMGGHAEFLVMPERGRVVLKPINITFDEAASLPFGAMTALDFLHRGGVKAGDRVLVNGASGNVGSAAVQLAAHAGAHVTAVCSHANAALVRELGASDTIDYAKTDFASSDDRFDLIIDAVGNAGYRRVRRVLARGGRLLAVLADLPSMLRAPFVRGEHRVVAGPVAEKVEDLSTIVDLAARGLFKPVIDSRYPFDRIADAYRVVDSGRKRGSVIVSV
jgi:NADPH:quinone reductase-like Zn-dependent oxidoreductase